MKRFAWAASGLLLVLMVAGWSRSGAFWSAHNHPVEAAYTALAMKMGTNPGLSGYHYEGVVLRSQAVQVPGSEGLTVSVVTPQSVSTHSEPSFAGWPEDVQPFKLKPPLFAALLAYAHHRYLGFKTQIYPLVLTAHPTTIQDQLVRRFIWDVQAWAVVVPFVSGLASIILVFLLSSRISGPGTGLVAATLTALHPYQSLTATHVWPEATLAALLLLTALAIHYFVLCRSWAGCFAAGIIYALAILTDPSALFALPAFWFWMMVRDETEQRPLLRRILSPYFTAFVAGAFLIARCWPEHTSHVLGDSMFSRTHFEISGFMQPVKSWADGAWGFFVFCPPLIAALLPRSGAVYPALAALSFIMFRWIYSPSAPWDERVWAVIVPFAAIAAAPGFCATIRRILSMRRAA